MSHCDVEGARIHYLVRGEGEPLFLLHGFTGCSKDWAHAGIDHFAREYRTIAVDARGHGHSTNPDQGITHRRCASDLLALADALGIGRFRAIGMSMGGNTLLHAATLQPERIEAMVVVSATMYFPDAMRAEVRKMNPDAMPEAEWRAMRERHALGDEQILALFRAQRAIADSYDDMNFTPPALARIAARTLVVYGDRDPLYPVEMGVAMYRAIPRASLWVVPGGGHGPIFLDAAEAFARTSLAFLR